MKLHKQGVEGAGSLMRIILVIFVFIVLVSFFTGALDIFKKSSDDALCKMTVLGQDTGKAKVYGRGLISLNCPRRNIVIEDNLAKYSQSDTKDKTLKKFDPRLILDKEQFYKLAADEMGDCWNKMGEGKLDVFNSNIFFGGNRHTCLICSHISFKLNPQTDFGTATDFTNYLKNHNYTRNSIDMRYEDYMKMHYSGKFGDLMTSLYYRADDSLYIHGFDTKPTISSSDDYVVFFKGLKFIELEQTAGDILSTAGLDFNDKDSILNSDDNYYIYFARPESVAEVCGILIN